MAKDRQQSSVPPPPRKSGADGQKWSDGAVCALRDSRGECTMSDHVVYVLYFIISNYIITILLVIVGVPGPIHTLALRGPALHHSFTSA